MISKVSEDDADAAMHSFSAFMQSVLSSRTCWSGTACAEPRSLVSLLGMVARAICFRLSQFPIVGHFSDFHNGCEGKAAHRWHNWHQGKPPPCPKVAQPTPSKLSQTKLDTGWSPSGFGRICPLVQGAVSPTGRDTTWQAVGMKTKTWIWSSVSL